MKPTTTEPALGKVDMSSEIRCPFCNKKHADGKHPTEPLRFKCTRCGKFFVVERIGS
jgi:transposase-like protein